MSTFDTKKATFNTAMLYLMTAAKLIFPLITLPYLTRILSVDNYAVVTYVKACMSYFQLFVDFGFILSAVKDIVDVQGDKDKISEITGHVIVSRVILALLSTAVLLVLIMAIPFLRANTLFTLLSFVVVFLSAFLLDFLYRGIEKMHLLAIVFVTMKGISTFMTLIVVRSDADLLWIPILDIISSVVAVVINIVMLKIIDVKIKFKSFKKCFEMLKVSWTYFISSIATTAFTALNTVLIGIFILPQDVAFWSVSLQLISAVQNLYTPINNGIYPQMIQSRSFKPIKKVLMIFMPIVIIGCVFCYFAAPMILKIICGVKYVGATSVFRALIPVLFFSFPGMLLGWPTLGAIERVKETTRSTVITAIVQCIGLGVLLLINQFNIIIIALFRGATECLMMVIRAYYCFKFKNEFVKE